jgi:hypothetical protein
MTLTRGLLLVLGLTAFGCVVGGALGYTLGTTFPGYYRGVFPNGKAPEFDPVAVGLGLGLSQGAMFGAVLGTVILVAFLWYDLRCRQIAAQTAARLEDSPPRKQGITSS